MGKRIDYKVSRISAYIMKTLKSGIIQVSFSPQWNMNSFTNPDIYIDPSQQGEGVHSSKDEIHWWGTINELFITSVSKNSVLKPMEIFILNYFTRVTTASSTTLTAIMNKRGSKAAEKMQKGIVNWRLHQIKFWLCFGMELLFKSWPL